MRRKDQRMKGRRGSLLIESLLAIMILSMGIALIVKSMSQSLRSLASADMYTDVFLLSDSEMIQLMQTQKSIVTNTNPVSFSSPYEAYSYRVGTVDANQTAEVSAEEEGLQAGIAPVSLELLWKQGSKSNRFKLDSYVFVPDENSK